VRGNGQVLLAAEFRRLRAGAHPHCPSTGSLEVRALMAEVAKRGKPVLFMAQGERDAADERELGQLNPGLTIIHAHGWT